jgi:formylglycine-generating enzyme required for sulfatase activity
VQQLHAVGPGKIRLLYDGAAGAAPAAVAAFQLMVRPVTNQEFLEFVTNHPRWQRGTAPALFADAGYLSHWEGPLELGKNARPNQPVVRVSWFAGKAFCQTYGMRLPNEAEWELAAAADSSKRDARQDSAFRERILKWYSRPLTQLPDVPAGPANVWGIKDLHGVVWEWVYDFNNNVVRGDSRDRRDGDTAEFCGATSLNANDTSDYPSFMRYAFRSSLSGSSTAGSLGFRCAADAARGAPNRAEAR